MRWKGGTEMVLNKTAMAIFLMVAGNCVAGGYGTGWKGIPWGSSPADFEKALPEVTDWERAETHRAFFTEIVNRRAAVMASFVNSKLTSVKILFQESFLNKNGHINSFSAVKALLDKKYGEVELKVNWKNRLYADDQENFGMAIGMGHLVIGSQWEDPHTTVSMLLTGENFKVNHLLQYESKKLKDLQESASTQEALGDL